MRTGTAEDHAALSDIEYQDGYLMWAGHPIYEIEALVGGTPFYVYDKQRIENRINQLRAALPKDLHLHYAIKANPNLAVVQMISNLVDGLDVASAGELAIALETTTKPKNISFAGPGKQDWELERAVLSGITINVESVNEINRVARIGVESGKRPRIAIRVNPAFELKTAGMKMGGRPAQFGIDAEVVPDVLKTVSELDLDFCGFHVFSGSQNLRVDAIADSLRKTVDLVLELASATQQRIEFVNLGGGLGIPYFPGEVPLDLDKLTPHYELAINTLRSRLNNPEIILELGRYIVGESGLYTCSVIDVKESRGRKFAVCDGGLHHHLAATGNFGQVIRKNYPVAAGRMGDDFCEISIVGPLCTPLDLLADRVMMPTLHPGNLIAVLQSGAYGKSASPHGFLSHPDCGEILL